MTITTVRNLIRICATGISVAVLAVAVALGTTSNVRADEAAAKSLMKGMSDYLVAQKAISFSFDSNLEVVTKDQQKLMLSNSGKVVLNRPDKIRAMRRGGFADVEIVFDGKKATLLDKNANAYAQLDAPGTIDNLIDVLRDKYNMVLPGADLLSSNPNDVLMADVEDVKDLGSAVIGDVECDHLAFRAKEIDWQIWIAQGKRPYPCKFVITSKLVAGGPQYSIQVRDWKAGSDSVADTFAFKAPASSKKVELADMHSATGDLPQNFSVPPGDSK